MDALHLLKDLVLLYGVGSLVVYLLHRIGQSPVLGFLLTGVLIGPHGLGLIPETEAVEMLAEIGVMILLFSIGLEFSLRKLMQLRRVVLGTGPIQVLLSILLVLAIAGWSGLSFRLSLILGFALALSSTAVVLRMLVDGSEIDSIHGRVSLGVLIFQDFCVVPMIIVIPLLSGSESVGTTLALALLKALGVVTAVVVVARYLFPLFLSRVVETRSRELFMITSIFLLLGTAWVTAVAGFSLVLGAFLAGLILSESEYSSQVFARIRPLQESLNSLFFISIGMLVDPSFISAHFLLVAALIGAVILGKGMVMGAAVLITGFPVQVALLTALPMAQIGEFSFILLQTGLTAGVLPSDWHQLMITVAVTTMMLTPGLRWLARAAVNRTPLGKWGVAWGRKALHEQIDHEVERLTDHVIICGFGVSGRNVASVLKANRVPYLILDLNPQTIHHYRKEGFPTFFGDCTDPEILNHAGIERARVLLLVISDPFSTRRAVQTARTLNPRLSILTRTKYVSEINELRELGTDEVVSEEFEATIELLWRILRQYHFPRDLVRDEIRQIRERNYEYFTARPQTLPRLRLGENLEVYTENMTISRDCPFCNRRLSEIPLREKSHVLVLGIIRAGETISNPTASEAIKVGDTLILAGTKQQLKKAAALLSGASPSPPGLSGDTPEIRPEE